MDTAKGSPEKFVCECGKQFDKLCQMTGHQSKCKVHQKILNDIRESRRLPNGLFPCDNPGCTNEHDGSYGSGRFCSKHCRLSFIAKEGYQTKRKNHTFVSGFFAYNKSKQPSYGTWKCKKCDLIFETRLELENHLQCCHHHQKIVQVNDKFMCPYCHKQFDLKQSVVSHLFSCPHHPDKIFHDEAHRKAGKTLSANIKSGKTKAAWSGKHHTEETKRKMALKGGKREHSGRGKQGRYHGIWCDSSWELAWVIYAEEHKIKFQKYRGYFEYFFNGKIHKYYPDFLLEDGTILEIKGAENTLQWKAKLEQFPTDKRLIVLNKNGIQPYLQYVESKYGKDFIRLYDLSDTNRRPRKRRLFA